MKRRYLFILGAILILSLVIVNNYFHLNRLEANTRRSMDLINRSRVEKQEDLAEDLIRFHILANSDSKRDQDIKLKVKDRVLREITPNLRTSKNIQDTRNIIKNSQRHIIEIANKVLKENGEDYGAKTILGSFSFPAKYYGRFSLPPGEYEAFQIVLGEGKGSNWWCVMFPPLCFINVEREEEPQEIQEDPPQGVQIRWKFLELIKSLFKNHS
ncbi:MAG TPA: stage II sporulation protein R [Eubacteriaceae bacterium]|nr:stage II sporulation protein R [Eubacteriaceae bacterium]